MIFTSIATAIGALFGASATSFFVTATAWALKTVAGIGLNMLLAKKQKAPEFSISGTIQSGEGVSRSILLGYRATRGSLVYANTWGNVGGTPNAYFTQVISVSDWPIQDMGFVWIDGRRCTIDWDHAHPDGLGYPVVEYKSGGVDYCWIKFYDGTQTAADSFLVSKVSNEIHPYESTRVGYGVAYIIVTSRVNQSLFTSFPEPMGEYIGAKLYDITKDSTQGGSGTQRWSTPSTWGGDGDLLLAVQLYCLIRGLRWNDNWFYGLQQTNDLTLPSDNWRAAIAACRLEVEGVEGNAPSFRVGIEIPVSTTLADTVQAYCAAGNARMSEHGGAYNLFIGIQDATFSFTDNDIITTSERTFTPFRTLEDTVNGATGKYPDPESAWETKDLPPIYNPALEVMARNRRLLQDVSLDLIPYADQAQRVLQAGVLDAQRERRHTLVLPPEYRNVIPGDIGSWTSTENGYSAKKFRAEGVQRLPNLDIMVDLQEVDPTDYSWSFSTDYRPVTPGTVGINYPDAQVVSSWTPFAYTIYDTASQARRPTIGITYPGDLDDVLSLRVHVRLKSDASAVSDTTVQYGTIGSPASTKTSILAAGPYLPSETYQVSVTILHISGRIEPDTSWIDVTTDAVFITGTDIAPGSISITEFADGIAPVEILPSTPSNSDPANFDGRLVYNTTTNVLWRFNGTSWERMVATDILANDITSTKIADAAIIAAKLATGAVTELKLADSAVTQNKIATGAVLEAKLADNAVTTAKVNNLAINATKIADAAITNAKLGSLAVDAAKLADNAVTEIKINNSAVTLNKIAAGAVNASKIASGAAIVETFATAPVTGNFTGRMYFNSTDKKLYRYDGTAWVSSIASVDISGTLSDSQLAAISAAKITGQITGTQITDNAITTPKIAAGAVTSNSIAANTIVAADIAAGAITATEIASGAITTTKLAAGAVTANEIAANAVTAVKIAANTISSDKLVANAITTRELYIGNFTNLCGDPKLANPNSWASVGALATFITGTGVGYNGNNSALETSDAAGAVIYAIGYSFPIQEGESLYVAGVAKKQTATSGAVRIYVQFLDGAGVANGSGVVPNWTAADTTYTTKSQVMTAPPGTAQARVIIDNAGIPAVGTFRVGYIVINKRSDGNLIVDGAITANKVDAGAITTAKLAAGAVTTNELATNSVTSIKIVSNAIVADKIAANAVTARNLILTDTGNLVPDNQFSDFNSWVQSGAGSMWSFTSVSSGNWNSKCVAVFNNALKTTGFTGLISLDIPVKANTVYRMAIQAYLQAPGTTSQVIARVQWFDYSHTSIGFSNLLNNVPISSLYNETEVTSPAGARTAQYQFYVQQDNTDGNVIFAGPVFQEKNAASLIVSGGIISDYLATNSVTSAKISATAVVAGKIAANAVTATEIASNSITTAKIAAGAVTATEIATGAITAIKIAAGTITSDKLVASSITARELVLVDFSNVIPDAGLLTNGWSLGSGTTVVTVTSVWRSPNVFNHVIPAGPPAGWYLMALSDYIQVTQTEIYQGYAQVWANTGNHQFWIIIQWYDETKTSLPPGEGSQYSSIVPSAVRSGLIDINTQIAVPIGARYGRLIVYVTRTASTVGAVIRAGGLILRRKGDANLIVDGSIIASKLAANSVTASAIAANTITAGQIAAGAIGATQIAAGAVTAAKMAAGSVTTTALAAGSITADKITAGKLDAAEILQDGTLITELLGPNAVSEFGNLTGSVSNPPHGSGSFYWTDIATETANLPSSRPILFPIMANLTISCTTSNQGTAACYRIINTSNGDNVVWQSTTVGQNGTGTKTVNFDGLLIVDRDTVTGDNIYKLQVGADRLNSNNALNTTGTADITLMWWKR